jgi:hypothetical protein
LADTTRIWPLLGLWRGELAWIKRWGISIVSFVGGCLTLLVFRRGLPGVGWIIGYVVLLWLLFVVLTQVRQALMARGRGLIVVAADYTIQTLYHGLLLFALPAYYASSTLSSTNILFVALLLLLALLATFDPLYQAVVHPRPWMNLVFFVVSTFAALAVALPLIGVPPFVSLIASAFASVVVLTPEIRRPRGWAWTQSFAVASVLGLAAAALVGLFRAWIPPAPLTVARALVTDRVENLEPGAPLESPIPVADLRRLGGVIAYTAIYAPASLRETIEHVWRLDGAIQAVVRLSPVEGGRRQGFRTYSRKSNFPPNPVGRWTVDVMTSSGQLIGRLRFRVVP